MPICTLLFLYGKKERGATEICFFVKILNKILIFKCLQE